VVGARIAANARKGSDRKSAVSIGALGSGHRKTNKDEPNKQKRPDSACSSTYGDQMEQVELTHHGSPTPFMLSSRDSSMGANHNELKFSVRSILAADDSKSDQKLFEKRNSSFFLFL
jgi:hypothetical protein